MGFIDSYKRLEKLCSEVYGDNHGISAYIDEMVKKSDGSYCVSGWNEDLKQLKHYRWLRNQIVHEPNCSEENMCTPEDTQWIDDFHSRIMSANDPLAQYRKFKRRSEVQRTKQNDIDEQSVYVESQYEKTSHKYIGCFTFIIGIILVAVVAVLVLNINQ